VLDLRLATRPRPTLPGTMPSAPGASSAARHSVVIFRGLTPPPDANLTRLALSPSPPTALYVLSAPASRTWSATVVELARAATPHTSWLLRLPPPSAAVVESCGDVAFISAVDPLFAALPMLAARRDANGTSSLQPADSLLVDANNYCCANTCTPQQLALVCDVQTVGDDSYYRVHDGKVLAWLTRKVSAVAAAPGVSAADALDLVCAYVVDEWADRLRAARAGAQTAEPDTAAGDGVALAYAEMARSARANAENAKAREREYAKMDGDGGAGRDGKSHARAHATGTKRRSSGQSKLDKQDLSGVRKVSSFFSRQ
jgi:hypothetical protein